MGLESTLGEGSSFTVTLPAEASTKRKKRSKTPAKKSTLELSAA